MTELPTVEMGEGLGWLRIGALAQRRVKCEGSVYQRHDHPSCPLLIDGERADRSCRGTA